MSRLDIFGNTCKKLQLLLLLILCKDYEYSHEQALYNASSANVHSLQFVNLVHFEVHRRTPSYEQTYLVLTLFVDNNRKESLKKHTQNDC